MTHGELKSRIDFEVDTRRRVIVEAARRLVADRDVEAASMEEIAAGADYTRRTLYSYFTSRDEILLQVLFDDLVARWRIQQEAMDGASSGLEKIQAWARSLYGYSKEHPESVRLQAYWDYRRVDETRIGRLTLNRFKTLNNELADGLREIFRLGVEDGSLRPGLNIDICISQFLHALRTVIHRALSPGYSFASFDPDVYVEHFEDLFCRSIQRSRSDNETR